MASSIGRKLAEFAAKLSLPIPLSLGGTGKTSMGAAAVGTVTQAAGIATGAIVEKGSNANGTWTKFADGRMICELRRTRNTAVNAVYGGIYYNGGPAALVYPQAFISIPWTDIRLEGTGLWTAYTSPATLTEWPSYYMLSAVSRVTSDVNEHFIAIGRWY